MRKIKENVQNIKNIMELNIHVQLVIFNMIIMRLDAL